MFSHEILLPSQTEQNIFVLGSSYQVFTFSNMNGYKNSQLISRSATNGNRKQISTLSLHYSGVDIGLEKAKLHLKFAEHAVNDRDSV